MMALADPSPSSLSHPRQSARPLWPPTRPSLRRFLLAVLPTDADLDAFVSDHFVEVYRRYSAGMDRLQKYTLLLDHKPRHIILSALREHDGEQFQLSEHLLDYGLNSSEAEVNGETELRRPPRRSHPPVALRRRLPKELESGLFGTGDGAEGLAAELVDALLGNFGRRASAPYRPPTILSALRRAAVVALDELLPRPAQTSDSADFLARLRDWLLSRAVVGNLAPILQPTEKTELDLALFSEEFSAASLRPEELGHDQPDDASCALLRGFFRGLLRESSVHELINIAELRRALKDAEIDVELAAPSQGQSELLHLQNLAQRIAAGEAMPDELMQALGQLFASVALQPDRLRQQLVYQVAEQALHRAGLASDDQPDSVNSALPDETQRRLDELHAQLDEMRQRLSEQSGLENPAELLELERAYRQQLRDQFGRLTFKGITPSGTALGLPLKEVYVDLKAVTEVPELADTYSAEERRLLNAAERDGESTREMSMHLDSLRLTRWRQEGRQKLDHGDGPAFAEETSSRSRFRPRSVTQLLSETDKPGLVILGDPGSGKTTLLHYLALCTADDGLQKSELKRPSAKKPLPDLPIFVPLAAYDDHLRRSSASLSLEEFLPIYYEKWRGLPGLAPLFQKALRSGRVLLLLDGLDEVLDIGTRQHVAAQTDALLHRFAGSGNRFVVTSRVVGYREAPLSGELPHVTVLDFGKEEITHFASKWCEAFEVWASGGRSPSALRQAATETRALLADLRATPSVALLAANPLLLTMLALLRRQVGTLPDRRIELYERYVRTLLDQRETTRSPGARQQAPDRLDVHTSLHFLTELSLWLQQHSPSGTARQREILAALVRIALAQEGHTPATAPPKLELEAQRLAARFLREMRHVAGLLAERGRDAFGFLHLTFQEYFVGRALARRSQEERFALLAGKLHNPRWREPLLLAAGWLGIIEGRTAEVDALLQRILDAGSDHEAILHRDLLLAASIAADNVGVSRPQSQKLSEWLRKLEDHPARSVQKQAFYSLGQLARCGDKDAASYLKALLKHASADQQEIVLSALTPSLITALPELRQLVLARLEPGAWRVRVAAVELLRDDVAHDAVVRKTFLDCLDDSDAGLREEILSALVTVMGDEDHGEDEVRRVVLARLSSQSTADRCDTLWALSPLCVRDGEIRYLVSKALDDPKGFVVRTALRALAEVIPANEMIRQSVLSLVSHADESVRQSAIRALAPMCRYDDQIRDLLRKCLRSPVWRERQAAVRALSELVHQEEYRQAILDCLKDPEWLVREPAVQALSAVCAEDPRVRKALLAALSDPALTVQSAAVVALSPHLSQDAEVREALALRLDGGNDMVRGQSIRALSKLLPLEPRLAERMLGYLKGADPFLREAAAHALRSLSLRDAAVRRELLLRLFDPMPEVRLEVVRTLGDTLILDGEVQQGLWGCMTDESPIVRQAAVHALRPIRNNPLVRRGFLRCASDADSSVRQAAIEELSRLAAQDSEAYQKIFAALSDSAPAVRRAALLALSSLFDREKAVRDAVFFALRNMSSIMRQAAIDVLAPHLSRDAEIRQAIFAAIKDTQWQVRATACTALCLYAEGEVRVEVLPAVLSLRNDGDHSVRAALIQGLGRHIQADPAARGLVFAALAFPLPQLRSAAIEGLGAGDMLLKDAEARAAVLAHLSDGAWEVRRMAVRALLEIVSGSPEGPCDRDLALRLLPWLGCYSELQGDLAHRLHKQLVPVLAPIAANDAEMTAQLVHMLDSASAADRLGAARTLLAMPGGPPLPARPRLCALVDDLRSEFTWTERLQTIEVFLNATDPKWSERAVKLALQALDCAAEPWQDLPEQGPHVRAEAARLLGQLDPLYRDGAMLTRLLRVLQEDAGPTVRDAAYAAISRLLCAPESPLPKSQ